jgi:NAD(P)-dependent dehydrogenase (short-subunit alcohol dehydrogenase family)
MRQQQVGRSIVNIGTVLIAHPSASLPESAALITKGGVHALTTSLACELAADNIKVNAVAPGVIRTPIYGDADVDVDVDVLGTTSLLNRAGEVNEITDAVVHLASAHYTTGVIMPVDGGNVHGRG